MAQYNDTGIPADDVKKHMVDWLRDAHAMEVQAETMLKKQLDRIEHYPDLTARIEQHITETQNQAKLVEECLKRYDASYSGVKDLGAKVTAMGQAMGGMFVGDEVVKGVQASYVFENLEIASYKILIAAAEIAGDSETKSTCERILKEEIAMAEWLSDYMPKVTQEFLARETIPDAEAKR